MSCFCSKTRPLTRAGSLMPMRMSQPVAATLSVSHRRHYRFSLWLHVIARTWPGRVGLEWGTESAEPGLEAWLGLRSRRGNSGKSSSQIEVSLFLRWVLSDTSSA